MLADDDDGAEVAPPCGLWQTVESGETYIAPTIRRVLVCETEMIPMARSGASHKRESATEEKNCRLLLSPARIFDVSNSRMHPPDGSLQLVSSRSVVNSNRCDQLLARFPKKGRLQIKLPAGHKQKHRNTKHKRKLKPRAPYRVECLREVSICSFNELPKSMRPCRQF